MNETTLGRRSDLEVAPLPGTEKYVMSKVIPALPKKEKTGTLYYSTLVSANADTQTPNAGDVALTTTYLTASETDFAVAGIADRFGIKFAEVDSYGGINAADQAGGEGAKLSVMNKLEKLTRNALMAKAGTAQTGAIMADIKIAVKKIKRYKGRKVIVMSESTFDAVKTYPDVRAAIKAFPAYQMADQYNIFELNAAAAASLFNVDEVIIGDDDFWAATETISAVEYNFAQRIAVLAVAPPEIDSHRMQAVFAKEVQYYPGDSRFELTAFPDYNFEANKYDCKAWSKIVVFNADACQVITGVVEQAISDMTVSLAEGTTIALAEGTEVMLADGSTVALAEGTEVLIANTALAPVNTKEVTP